MIDRNTKLSDCTVGELFDFLQSVQVSAKQPDEQVEDKSCKEIILNGESYVRGIAGIMSIFSISRSQASKYIKSEWLKPAIIRDGYVIYVNKCKAVEQFNKEFGLCANNS